MTTILSLIVDTAKKHPRVFLNLNSRSGGASFISPQLLRSTERLLVVLSQGSRGLRWSPRNVLPIGCRVYSEIEIPHVVPRPTVGLWLLLLWNWGD